MDSMLNQRVAIQAKRETELGVLCWNTIKVGVVVDEGTHFIQVFDPTTEPFSNRFDCEWFPKRAKMISVKNMPKVAD